MRLFEREEALSCLSGLFIKCRQGRGRVAVITGAMGTGKTELIQTIAEEEAAAGAIYCSAAASRAERGLQFGVIAQLFHSAGLPAKIRQRAAKVLESGTIRTSGYPKAPGPSLSEIEASLRVSHHLGDLLVELTNSNSRPLVIAVDDAQHADPPSLQCLSLVIRRLQRARAMVIISVSLGSQPFHPEFLADLPPEPYCRHIRLDVLSQSGVKAMLADHLGNYIAESIATECYSISGGNPALINGVINDYRQSSMEPNQKWLEIGPGTGQALLWNLHRGDSDMLNLARWLAILGDSAPAHAAGSLAGLSTESTTRALSALNRSGSLDNSRFRHPNFRTAVLDGLAAEDQAAMNARAAEFLRVEGFPATVIAHHLLLAERVEEAWAVPVLNEAAEQALSTGDVSNALLCLRLANHLPANGGHRSATRALLARAQWRVNPALAMRHGIDAAVPIQHADTVGQHALTWVSRLLWFGRAYQAREALLRINASRDALDPATATQFDALRAWFSCLFPSADESGLMNVLGDASPIADPLSHAISLLVGTLTDQSVEPTGSAERFLQETVLEERTFVLLASALAALVYGRRADTADTWCDSLEKDAAAHGAPTWQAVFTAIRSVLALRQGRVVEAAEYARTALTLITIESWGILVGIPLGSLVQAATMMGRYEEALLHLRTPIPDAIFETPVGLHYLQARGRFYYARGDLHGALREFRTIGDLTAQWGIDLPSPFPWRTDAALAYLRLGRNELAHDLVTEQLEKLASGHARDRGIALRILAACSELRKRPVLLRQAVKELQSYGDRLELAHALADLGHAYHLLGDRRKARVVICRAHGIAKQCGVAAMTSSLQLGKVANSRCADNTESKELDTAEHFGLSKAEQRVAVLAADGYSNREIASRLFVTVSTVEQHLTRVYSKLNISSRSDLLFGLRQDDVDTTQ